MNPHLTPLRAEFLSLGPYTPQPAPSHFRGFGCVPGLWPGVAPDGDDCATRPPPPHRDGTQEVLRVRLDPHLRQQRPQIHLVR